MGLRFRFRRSEPRRIGDPVQQRRLTHPTRGTKKSGAFPEQCGYHPATIVTRSSWSWLLSKPLFATKSADCKVPGRSGHDPEPSDAWTPDPVVRTTPESIPASIGWSDRPQTGEPSRPLLG